MKKILLAVVLVAAVAVIAMLSSFSAATLPVIGEVRYDLPPEPAVRVQLQAIQAGSLQSSAAFAYRGGDFGDAREFSMGGILVTHPSGKLLFDTGFGKDVDAHFKTVPLLMRLTSSYTKGKTVAEQLSAAGVTVDPTTLSVVLTHVHWDHVSGLPDLPGIGIMINVEEEAFIASGDHAANLIRSFGQLNWRPYSFSAKPYLGFEHSLDLFGDGSVVLVHAPGHTPGSIIAFVSADDGKTYALVGDLVWQREGIDIPAERPWISRRLADKNDAEVRDAIVHMHRLQQAMPNLVIVPAHDRRVWDTLPKLI